MPNIDTSMENMEYIVRPSSRRLVRRLLDFCAERLRKFHAVPSSERGMGLGTLRRHRHEGIGLMRKH